MQNSTLRVSNPDLRLSSRARCQLHHIRPWHGSKAPKRSPRCWVGLKELGLWWVLINVCNQPAIGPTIVHVRQPWPLGEWGGAFEGSLEYLDKGTTSATPGNSSTSIIKIWSLFLSFMTKSERQRSSRITDGDESHPRHHSCEAAGSGRG